MSQLGKKLIQAANEGIEIARKGITPEQLARSNTEHGHQTALFCWTALPEIREKYPALRWLFAIPNGGWRDKITAGKLKAEGVKEGVPDICLPIPADNFHGLFIEMKRPKTKDQNKGVKQDNQNEWIDFLSNMRFATQVCYSWEEARDTLIGYLK